MNFFNRLEKICDVSFCPWKTEWEFETYITILNILRKESAPCSRSRGQLLNICTSSVVLPGVVWLVWVCLFGFAFGKTKQKSNVVITFMKVSFVKDTYTQKYLKGQCFVMWRTYWIMCIPEALCSVLMF